MRRIIKDTILELWRGNVSYIIVIIMFFGLLLSVSATYSIKDAGWFQEIKEINIKKIGYLQGLLYFSFLWKGIILSILGSFAFSKYVYSDKLSFLFLSVDKKRFLISRLIGFILLLSLFFIFWNIILSFFAFPLKILSYIEVFIFSTIGDFLIFLFLFIPLFFGLYLSPVSTSFLTIILLSIGEVHIFLTPLFDIRLTDNIRKILSFFPDVIGLVMFFPEKYFSVPYGTLNIMPNFITLIIYVSECLIFFLLFILQVKRLEL